MNPLARRYVAALRTPPLDCGHRDPLACAVAPPRPSDFSMSRAELAAERRRLLAHGWMLHEVRAVLLSRGRRP